MCRTAATLLALLLCLRHCLRSPAPTMGSLASSVLGLAVVSREDAPAELSTLFLPSPCFLGPFDLADALMMGCSSWVDTLPPASWSRNFVAMCYWCSLWMDALSSRLWLLGGYFATVIGWSGRSVIILLLWRIVWRRGHSVWWILRNHFVGIIVWWCVTFAGVVLWSPVRLPRLGMSFPFHAFSMVCILCCVFGCIVSLVFSCFLIFCSFDWRSSVWLYQEFSVNCFFLMKHVPRHGF